MEEQVYLIKTVEQGQKLWEQLKEEEWESVIVCFHEDLLNLDVKNRLLPMLHKYQIEDAQVHWVEPETAFISGSSSFGGGISLNYYVKIEQLMFEYGMHALCLSYVEEAEKTGGLTGFLGGIIQNASGQSYLQMLVKNKPGLKVDGGRIVIDLDQWESFRKIAVWNHYGKTIGRDLDIEYKGMLNRCICLRFSWRA